VVFLEFSDNPVSSKDVVSPEGDIVANTNIGRHNFSIKTWSPVLIGDALLLLRSRRQRVPVLS
jgi:hypothetical protein